MIGQKQKNKILANIIALIGLVVVLVPLLTIAATPVRANIIDDAKKCINNAGNCAESAFTDQESSGIVSLTDPQLQGGLKAPSAEGYDTSLTKITSGREFVLTVVNYALGFLGLVAVVIVIYGGTRYLLSGGESSGTEAGMKAIKYAVIGIVIILGSYAIVNTVLKVANTPAGQQQGPQLASAPDLATNEYANEIYNITLQSAAATQNYLAARRIVSDASNRVDTLSSRTKTDKEIDSNVMKSEIRSNYDAIYDELTAIAKNTPPYSQIPDLVADQKAFVDEWLRANPKRAGQATRFNGNADDDSYGAIETSDYNQLVGGLKTSGTTTDDAKVNFSMKTIENEIKKDFEHQIDDLKTSLERIAVMLNKDTSSSDITRINIDTIENGYEALKSGTSKTGGTAAYKQALQDLVTQLSQLYAQVKDIKTVQVALSASVTSGNAPLIVNFSTIGSVDPSNASITGENVSWDLLGDGFDKTSHSGNCDEGVKAAVANCVYMVPGTYRIAVMVRSQDQIKYKGGIRYIDIKVNPPRARISLNVVIPKTAGPMPVTIAAYDQDGLMKINRSSTQVALSEAKNLKFSAEGTVSGELDTAQDTRESIKHIKWTFGDGVEMEDSPSDNPGIITVEHSYGAKGNYQAMLEVTGKDGITDRKVFTLRVSDISGIITILPDSVVKINQQVQFKSTVQSDGSKVKSIDWSSSPDNVKLKSKDPEFSAALENPGQYSVTLKVTNEDNGEAVDRVDVIVESNPPVAKFTATPPKKTKPAEIKLDGSPTYDPDGPNNNVLYKWSIAGEEGKDYGILDGSPYTKTMLVRFLTTGPRDITLTVEDKNEKGKATKATQSIKIDTTLDADWAPQSITSAIINNEGHAPINLAFTSNGGESYTIDYGDGQAEDGQITNKAVQITHDYTAAGTYQTKVTVRDSENHALELLKKIYIGGGLQPLAATHILVDGVEAENDNGTITVNRKNVITFDASDAKNARGTKENLDYVWGFGDGKKSAKATVTYSYKDLSPDMPGYFTAKITVRQKDDTTKKTEQTFKIKVVSQKPTMKSMVVVPLGGEMKSPLKVQLKAADAQDPDGTITSYRWWYYDTNDNENELGGHMTTVPETTITVGTKGNEGEEKKYVFVVELRDNDNQTITSSEILGDGNLPKLTVTNGPNKPPVSSFTVNKTSVDVGESVTFTASASDPDGKIMQYIWDLDGDGFQNDEPTTKASVTKAYKAPAPNGISVKLKVIDDSFSETVSTPVTIYITSKTQPPKAAFTVASQDGYTVNLKSNATSDTGTTIASHVWDCDVASSYTSADSDGDGKKDNDTDATSATPACAYTGPGIFFVKMTVTDSVGLSSSVTNPVTVTAKVGATGTPTFATGGTATTNDATTPNFTSPLNAKLTTKPAPDPFDGKIHLTGETGNIALDFSKSEGPIALYVIDKNIYFDSNGDGVKDNDENYKTGKSGTWTTDFQQAWGKIGIKLTVFDATGKSNSVMYDVVFDNVLKSGANNIFVIPGSYELYGALASMFGFGILAARRKKNKDIT